MKVCLRGRQDRDFLHNADEIKLEYRDRKIIPDYARDYPGAYITIELGPNVNFDDIDWKAIEDYSLMCNEKFYLCVSNLEEAVASATHGINFYCGYPIESDFELQGWINAGAAYARLGMPLFFEMDRMKEMYGDKIKFRTVPNVAYLDNLPRDNGINGQWIRPEDLILYEQYIDTIEFETINKKQEQALYKRYVEIKEWPGDLNLLITNLNAEGTNPMIIPEFTKRRLNCGQRCARGGACRMCYTAMKLANSNKIKSYVEEVVESN